jgi:hypothetical protein
MADHPHTIDRWDDATGENTIEQIAAVGDYLVALETYRAAVSRWPKDKITLRNRARVLEQSRRDQPVVRSHRQGGSLLPGRVDYRRCGEASSVI